MGRPRKWASDKERMAAKRAAAKREALGERPPSPDYNPDVPVPVSGTVTAMNEKAYTQVLEAAEEAREQAIRDSFRYEPSEKRTRAERNTAAARMLGEAPMEDLAAAYRAGYDGQPCPDPDSTPVAQAWAAGLLDRRSGLPALPVYRPLPTSRPESRAQAAAIGRRYGAHEADRRGEHGAKREARIERAEAYAIWVYEDGPSRSDPSTTVPPRGE